MSRYGERDGGVPTDHRARAAQGGSQMTKHARTVLLVSLWINLLLLHGLCSIAVPLEQSEPGMKLGGTYRLILYNTPPTLDPSFTTDVFSRTVVTQMFDGLVQFDAYLTPVPAIAEFWE